MRVVAAPAHRTRHTRLRMLKGPRDKFFVSGEYDVDQLIEHVLGRLAEKRRVRVQGLLILLIQAGAELDEALPTRAGFDDGHTHSFPERHARGGDPAPSRGTGPTGDRSEAQSRTFTWHRSRARLSRQTRHAVGA